MPSQYTNKKQCITHKRPIHSKKQEAHTFECTLKKTLDTLICKSENKKYIHSVSQKTRNIYTRNIHIHSVSQKTRNIYTQNTGNLYAQKTRCGVATISRLLKIIGVFCKISSVLWGSFTKETYNFKEPTNRSHD